MEAKFTAVDPERYGHIAQQPSAQSRAQRLSGIADLAQHYLEQCSLTGEYYCTMPTHSLTLSQAARLLANLSVHGRVASAISNSSTAVELILRILSKWQYIYHKNIEKFAHLFILMFFLKA